MPPRPRPAKAPRWHWKTRLPLAQCLRDCPDIPTGFRTFESLRREQVQRVVKQGARSATSKAVGSVGRRVRDINLPLGSDQRPRSPARLQARS
jgi:hypothetical protein